MIMTRRFVAVLLSCALFLPLIVHAEAVFESVTKDAAFRGTLELSDGEAFVLLSQGHTYYRTANLTACEGADVLVHGFSVPSYIWEPTFDFLASKGRCVVMLDLYGPRNLPFPSFK